MGTSPLLRSLDLLDSADRVLPSAGSVRSGEAARAEDVLVGVADARLVLAAMEELLDLIERDRHDAANVQDIATDVLPRLVALQELVVEQVAEVTR